MKKKKKKKKKKKTFVLSFLLSFFSSSHYLWPNCRPPTSPWLGRHFIGDVALGALVQVVRGLRVRHGADQRRRRRHPPPHPASVTQRKYNAQLGNSVRVTSTQTPLWRTQGQPAMAAARLQLLVLCRCWVRRGMAG